jgi:hypothetical protein
VSNVKYLGPADAFQAEPDGKFYRPGEAIPLSAEARRHHELYGHRFEDTDDAAVAVARAAMMPAPPAPEPRDDRGASILLDKNGRPLERQPAAPAVAAQPAVAAKKE